MKSLIFGSELVSIKLERELSSKEQELITKIDEWMATHDRLSISPMPYVNDSFEIECLMYDVIDTGFILKILNKKYHAFSIQEDTYTRYMVERKKQCS